MKPSAIWNDHYSVGDEFIDAQHKQILDDINNLFDAREKKRGRAALTPICDRLLENTTAHFRREEQVMQECGYPHFAQHKAFHDKMRERTVELRDKVHLTAGEYLLVFLKDWWTGHIQGQDKKLAPYLSLVAAAGKWQYGP